MQTARIITPEHEPVEKSVSAHVVSTRNLVIAAILVALLAISAGIGSGIVAAQAFDTPGAQGAQCQQRGRQARWPWPHQGRS